MKIKTRLAMQFTIVVTAFLFAFSVLIYYFWFATQQAKFRENLLRRAKNTVTLFSGLPEIDSKELEVIHRNTLSWRKEEILITDSAFHLIYSNRPVYLNQESIKAFTGKSESEYFSILEKDGVRYTQNDKNGYFNVFVMAYDDLRAENLSQLLSTIRWSLLIGLILSASLSYLFARKAILPVSKLVRDVRQINHEKLSSRLTASNEKDELWILAESINELLTRLENVIRNQKEFVNNASHELRTPLTILISEAEYILGRKQEDKDYKNHISKMLTDLNRMNNLANSLLELSRLTQESDLNISRIRVDEALFNVITELKIKRPKNKIISKVDYPDDQNNLLIEANQGLLELALRNIIDNACKFSDNEVLVEIMTEENFIKISVTDTGIGIPESELDTICLPFHRASNAKFKNGFGIGLSIVDRIVRLHKGDIKIESEPGKGTRVELIFRKPEEKKNL